MNSYMNPGITWGIDLGLPTKLPDWLCELCAKTKVYKIGIETKVQYKFNNRYNIKRN